ncbi:MarR family winged helix-turn-helix transcriptional regulator [Catenuloplanes atrovinosus]|uniref:DNA-binding MarR family transcriptional regulator n=1 Tax=Catenuloplanes atrovinosus TaxID=137266 RepID=A0AAE3YJ72_9ACTN|nr:MarR family transcriptional regulator [Catenuloplanes atrovinosus]MDR7274774.1 DNA-binding MarR family transcriptional regulator [Catenuloplanes atrovinosus]
MTTVAEAEAALAERARQCEEQGHKPIDTDLGWGLGVVFRAYVRASEHVVEDLPGGPRGYQILRIAAGDKALSQAQLAQHLGIDRTVMTYLLDDLEGAGLVERRPDPTDRRTRRIVATPHGQERLEVLTQRFEAAEEHALAPLAPGDRAVFRVLLQRLATTADAADPLTNPCEAVDESHTPAAEAVTAGPRRSRRR